MKKWVTNKKTLFIIDDEKNWLNIMKLVLEEAHYKVVTAESGKDALAKLLRMKPDLIISDLKMPDMNGFDLYEKIKHIPKLSDVPFAFMSGINDYDVKHEAKKIGVKECFEKPFDSEEMKRIVGGLFHKYNKIQK